VIDNEKAIISDGLFIVAALFNERCNFNPDYALEAIFQILG
jgi:hypothetical protein